MRSGQSPRLVRLFTVSTPEIIEAIAVSDNYLNSHIASGAYNIGLNPANEWTWMDGSSTVGESGRYGVLGLPAAANIPGGRDWAASWADASGNLWLFGGNALNGSGTQGFLNDLWKLNLTTGQWTWMGGSNAVANTCFPEGSITFCGEPGKYGTLGVAAAGNIPGGREWATSWTDPTGHFWLFGGWGFDANGTLGFLNDLWRFDPITNQWTWVSGNSSIPCGLYCGRAGVYGTLGVPSPTNIPGSRYQTASWVDSNGHLWMFGGLGYDLRRTNCYLNDLWEFDPSSNEWTWRSGSRFCSDIGVGMPGVYGIRGVPAASNVPGGRQDPMSWVDNNGHFWLFGGNAFDINQDLDVINDLWEFDPSTNLWAWMSGSPFGGSTGTYGTLGTPATGNAPGARGSASTWTDKGGNLWLFAGSGAGASTNPTLGTMNDLWKFNPAINEWAWMGGSSTTYYQSGAYGSLGTPASGNTPGARGFATTWTDSSGHFWLFGGAGYDAQGVEGLLNDLWEFGASAPSFLPPAATPTLSPAGGTFASSQSVTISDSIPGATIYYTTNGTTPTTSSTQYTGAITVSSTETIQAIAIASGYSSSTVNSAAYTIGVPPDFSVTASPASLTVIAGQNGNANIAIMPLNGFASTVSFSCSGLLAGTSCSFSPATVTPSGVAVSTTLTLTATTSASNQVPASIGYMPVAAGVFILCLVRRRNRGLCLTLVLSVAATLGLFCLSACGGGSSGSSVITPNPTPESGTVTITATSGSLTHTVSLSVSVN
jgi:N-acetylneuraminic acid mutarotase